MAGGNSNTSYRCPANTTSPPGSHRLDQCACLPGYYGPNGTACELCPPNTYCASGKLTVCPDNTRSASGADDIGDCVCNAGFYGSNGNCADCPLNMFCTGGTSVANCTAHAVTAGVRTISSGMSLWACCSRRCGQAEEEHTLQSIASAIAATTAPTTPPAPPAPSTPGAGPA